MRKILSLTAIVLLSLLLMACDKVVSSQETKVATIEKPVECYEPGYCMDCSLRMDGKFNCSPGFKVACEGVQDALVDIYRTERVHESGKTSTTNRESIVRKISECEI